MIDTHKLQTCIIASDSDSDILFNIIFYDIQEHIKYSNIHINSPSRFN